MKFYLSLFALFMLASCENTTEAPATTLPEASKVHSFYVGTYTDGDSHGIYKYALEKDGSIKKVGLAARSKNPSFLALSANKQFLVAVNETNNEDSGGTVESYAISGDNLVFISRSSSGGAHPCFVTLNEDGFILAANYTGGNVGLLKLNEDGTLKGLLDIQQHSVQNPTNEQDTPHAHSAWFTSDGNNIISVDLGTNQLWFSQLDPEQQKLLPNTQNTLDMAPGAGPRHLTIHPNGKWIYVVNELNSTVGLVQKNEAGEYELGASFSTLPEGFEEESYCADIHISSDGKFVYASNRGHNSIAIFSVNDSDGSLKPLGHESVRGKWPRNFSLSPGDDFLLVANQHTHNIVSYKRDKTTGLLEFASEVEAPTPVCILFN